jgi:hypothetical protein
MNELISIIFHYAYARVIFLNLTEEDVVGVACGGGAG